jgi:arylsulfatase A-like enzyme
MIVRWPGEIEAGSVSNALVSGVDLSATILEIAGLKQAPGMTGVSFLNELRGERFEERDHLFSERGWHFGPITQTDGFDLSRSITTRRYHYIYNAIPERRYSPVDMGKKPVWLAMQALNKQGKLSVLHERLYFHLPRPIFEFYDLDSDPFQLENLAGKKAVEAIETKLRVEMDKWMIRESDFLPLPSHVQQLEDK